MLGSLVANQTKQKCIFLFFFYKAHTTIHTNTNTNTNGLKNKKVLRHYYYQDDLTLHPRILPNIPSIGQREHDATIELTPVCYHLLEKIFELFADDSIVDETHHLGTFFFFSFFFF